MQTPNMSFLTRGMDRVCKSADPTVSFFFSHQIRRSANILFQIRQQHCHPETEV